MMNSTKGMLIDPMQSIRIAEHPIKINGNLIVSDNLEAGSLKIYEPSSGPIIIQQLFLYYQCIHNAVLVAEITINNLWKDNGVFIHKISCECGYENLITPMLYQVLHFSDFYDCFNSVGISETEYEKCLPYAKTSLASFQKNSRVYEYAVSGNDAE